MTPGPVPLPQEVLETLSRPMEHHRTPDFIATFNRVLVNLRQVYQTAEPVYIHTSTGSGGLESSLVNCLSPGDEVLAIVSGKFGERWADMAEAFGVNVKRLPVAWGKVVDITLVEDHLRANPKTVAVLTQACETSTGVFHPIRELAQLTQNHRAILIVDAITALGAVPMPMDEWGIDVMVGGSQKAFMLPTGLAFIAFSKKAWALTETAKCHKFYFDIRRESAANLAGESLFSSSVTLVRALDLVLEIFLRRGMHQIYQRIQALSAATIAAAKIFNLEIFAEFPSPSVTAIRLPANLDGQKIRAELEKLERVVVMGGQDQLKGKIIRIGHMGAISDEDLQLTMRSLAKSLNRASAEVISAEQMDRAALEINKFLLAQPAVSFAP